MINVRNDSKSARRPPCTHANRRSTSTRWQAGQAGSAVLQKGSTGTKIPSPLTNQNPGWHVRARHDDVRFPAPIIFLVAAVVHLRHNHDTTDQALLHRAVEIGRRAAAVQCYRRPAPSPARYHSTNRKSPAMYATCLLPPSSEQPGGAPPAKNRRHHCASSEVAQGIQEKLRVMRVDEISGSAGGAPRRAATSAPATNDRDRRYAGNAPPTTTTTTVGQHAANAVARSGGVIRYTLPVVSHRQPRHQLHRLATEPSKIAVAMVAGFPDNQHTTNLPPVKAQPGLGAENVDAPPSRSVAW